MRTEGFCRDLPTDLHGVTFQYTVWLLFTAVRTSKFMVIYVTFADLYTHNKRKSGSGGLPVADAAFPREVLFH
jgi:hypothetical protein